MGLDILAHSRVTLAGRHLNPEPGRLWDAIHIQITAVLVYAILDGRKPARGEIFISALDDRNAFKPGHEYLIQPDRGRYFRTKNRPGAFFYAGLQQYLRIREKNYPLRLILSTKKSPAQRPGNTGGSLKNPANSYSVLASR